MIETVNMTRVGDRWVKTVKYDDDFRFDPISYMSFRKIYGQEYLPTLHDYTWNHNGEWTDNYLTLEYDHIGGEQFPPVLIDEKNSRLINKTIKLISLKVIPDCIEFSEGKEKVFMHTDLKMDNIRIWNGKPYLIDIDSMGWIPRNSLENIYTEYEV